MPLRYASIERCVSLTSWPPRLSRRARRSRRCCQGSESGGWRRGHHIGPTSGSGAGAAICGPVRARPAGCSRRIRSTRRASSRRRPSRLAEGVRKTMIRVRLHAAFLAALAVTGLLAPAWLAVARQAPDDRAEIKAPPAGGAAGPSAVDIGGKWILRGGERLAVIRIWGPARATAGSPPFRGGSRRLRPRPVQARSRPHRRGDRPLHAPALPGRAAAGYLSHRDRRAPVSAKRPGRRRSGRLDPGAQIWREERW